MGYDGIASITARNTVASAFAGACTHLTGLKALTLQSQANAGASTITVDLAVQAGDKLMIETNSANQEFVVVQSTANAGLTATLTSPLGKTHAAGVYISHLPLDGTTVHEATVTARVPANWGSPAAGVLTAAPGQISYGGPQVVGSVAAFNALTAGTYQDAIVVTPTPYPSGGGQGIPSWIETVA